MATVSIVFRKDKVNKKGKAPIHLRIIKDRKIRYISTKIMIPVSFWDEDENKVIKKFPNSVRINNYIEHKFLELQDEVLKSETVSKSLSTRQLKEKIYGKKPTDFIVFSEESIEEYLSNNKIGTYDKSKSIIKKLKDYLTHINEGQLFFQSITPEFLEKYEVYLRDKKNNKPNTIHKNLRFIRKLFNDAIRKGYVDALDNPFLKHKLTLEKTQKIYLSEVELKKIEKLNLSKNTRMELHRDMFVFAAYTGGLRVSDILQLRWSNFDGTNINFTIRKTGQQLSIKLPNKALEIIKRYKPKKSNPKGFIFQMLPADLIETDYRLLDNAISSSTAYINKNLKLIATKAKINKPISFHISRHTFATRALTKGMTIDKVSKLMGHAAIKETQIYAKIVSRELDNAMDIFND
jgi:site-specific recombinase XerD